MKKIALDQKQANGADTIFKHFRTLGLISNHIASAWQTRSGSSDPGFHLITCIGNTFHIYDCAKITLLFVGPTFEEPILALSCRDNYTIVALPKEIVICERARESYRIPFAQSMQSPLQVECVADLLFVAFENKAFAVFSLQEKRIIHTLHLECIPTHFLPLAADKVLIAGSKGELQLWNYSKEKLIFQFPALGSPVSTLRQSPVPDVVGLGLADGRVALLNYRLNKILFTLAHPAQHAITALSFRSDNEHYPHLSTADAFGNVYLWNLEEHKLIHCIPNAHSAAIHTCTFVGNSGIILTVSSDNSIKQWHYDNSATAAAADKPLILKQRSGHREQPTCVEFYGEEGGARTILTGSRDRSFRLFSLDNDALAAEFSQKNLAEFSLSPITQISSSTLKAKQWDNIVTCHERENFVCTWRYETKALGEHRLTSSDKSPVKCCTISGCGNFVVLGTGEGGLDLFNIQSGILRRSWKGHSKGIWGLLVDHSNRKLISCSLDSTLGIWELKSGRLLERIVLDSVPSLCVACKCNDLFAVACDDFSILIWDFESQRLVRRLVQGGHSNRITDLAFSPDGRWVISSSLDCTIRTWDVGTGSLIGILPCSSIPTSISFSAGGDFLVSVHSGSVGIEMWSNMVHFSNACYNALQDSLQALSIGEEPIVSSSSSMICFSHVSKAKWNMLFNLENIKMRNKPKSLSKPEAAPFFLGSADSTLQKKEPAGTSPTSPVPEGSLTLDEGTMDKFNALLLAQDHEALSAYLKDCSASLIDLHIRSLPAIGSSYAELDAFLSYLKALCESGKDFELVQAYLHVVLNEFAACFEVEREHFAPLLKEIAQLIERGLEAFVKDLAMAQCLLEFNLKQ